MIVHLIYMCICLFSCIRDLVQLCACACVVVVNWFQRVNEHSQLQNINLRAETPLALNRVFTTNDYYLQINRQLKLKTCPTTKSDWRESRMQQQFPCSAGRLGSSGGRFLVVVLRPGVAAE